MEPRKLSNKRKPTNTGPMNTSIKENTAHQDVENHQPRPPNLQPVAETGRVILEKKAPAKSQQDSSPVPCDYLDKKKKTAFQDVENHQPRPPNLQPVAETGQVILEKKAPAKSQQDSSPVSCDYPDKKEEEPHATRSSWNDKKPTNTTCNKAGTIEESLMRSPQFREIAGKNRNKELVILRDGKATSSHFLCSLINNERLIVKYFETVDKPKQRVSGHRQRKRPSSELVMFHVLTKGGKGVMDIMRYSAFKTVDKLQRQVSGHRQRMRPSSELVMFHVLTKGGKGVKNIIRYSAFKTVIQEITVYAYKGEKVKQALRRDGRFLKTLFKKNCGLSEASTEVTTEMTNLVNDLHGKTFRIILLKMERKRTQQGSKRSRIQDLFRIDYRNSTQTYNEVRILKTLMDRSNSVCQVRINGNAAGSGFLLFGKFVLTNAHVVKGIFDISTWQLYQKVTVHFCFQSPGQMDSGIAVEEVSGFYFCPEPGHMTDWALLRLPADQKVPDGLLTRFGFLPQSGGICIVWHPSGESKKIDQCLIIPNERRKQVVEKHYHENPEGVYRENFQYLIHNFFEDVAQSVELNRDLLTYKSCFYHGSSGSPVFDEHCNVVAMHSGGYVYQNATGQRKSVIEYGYPLSGIIERILVQMVERGRFDVLKEYLACDFVQSQNVRDNLKKLIESRNLTAFEEALNSPLVRDDESLRKFFEFLSQREEPVPMEIDMP